MIQIAQMALLIYGILLVVGGVMGKVKAGSSVSLGAGVASGVIAFVGYWYSLNDPVNGFMIGAMLGLLLTGVFVNRFMRTRKMMPAGLVLILSLAVGILCVLARQEVLHQTNAPSAIVNIETGYSDMA